MTLTKILVIAAMCVVLCFILGVAVQPAQAQTASGDKDLAGRTGISGSLATTKKDDTKGATKLQMAVGVGSIFVMIAVVKWA